MQECRPPPTQVQAADVHGQLLGIRDHLWPTKLDKPAYLDVPFVPSGFRSWFLMKLNTISTGAIRKWYGPMSRTGSLSDFICSLTATLR